LRRCCEIFSCFTSFSSVELIANGICCANGGNIPVWDTSAFGSGETTDMMMVFSVANSIDDSITRRFAFRMPLLDEGTWNHFVDACGF
jgi:hypothetical protein